MDDEACDGLIDLMIGMDEEKQSIDENALNDMGWEFVAAWRDETDQDMSARTWNNLKPMLRRALVVYLKNRKR